MEVKDYVAVATGIIGCAAGLTALIRGFYLDRRLYWQPYFEKKWKQISAPLTNNIDNTNRWLTMLIRNLSEESAHALPISSSVPPPFSNIEWNYDRRMEKELLTYSSAFDNLTAQVNHYNILVALLDPQTYLELKIKDALVSEETQKDHMDRKQKIIELLKHYGGTTELSFEELKANTELAADIRKSKIGIETSIATLRPHLKKLQEAVDIYNAKFNI